MHFLVPGIKALLLGLPAYAPILLYLILSHRKDIASERQRLRRERALLVLVLSQIKDPVKINDAILEGVMNHSDLGLALMEHRKSSDGFELSTSFRFREYVYHLQY